LKAAALRTGGQRADACAARAGRPWRLWRLEGIRAVQGGAGPGRGDGPGTGPRDSSSAASCCDVPRLCVTESGNTLHRTHRRFHRVLGHTRIPAARRGRAKQPRSRSPEKQAGPTGRPCASRPDVGRGLGQAGRRPRTRTGRTSDRGLGQAPVVEARRIGPYRRPGSVGPRAAADGTPGRPPGTRTMRTTRTTQMTRTTRTTRTAAMGFEEGLAGSPNARAGPIDGPGRAGWPCSSVSRCIHFPDCLGVACALTLLGTAMLRVMGSMGSMGSVGTWSLRADSAAADLLLAWSCC
jgi:hypothetical protein